MSSAGPAASLKPPRGQKPLDLGKLPAVPGLAAVQGPSQGAAGPAGSSCRVCRRADAVPPGTRTLLLQSRKPAAKRRLRLLHPPPTHRHRARAWKRHRDLNRVGFGKSLGNLGAGGSAGAEHVARPPPQLWPSPGPQFGFF